MTIQELREARTPLKERYRSNPEAALNCEVGHCGRKGISVSEELWVYSKEAQVGFQNIRLAFDLDTDDGTEQPATLRKLTERYCVAFQTLRQPPTLGLSIKSFVLN
jgi:hypothetical protein